jgi:hypothetical protein
MYVISSSLALIPTVIEVILGATAAGYIRADD